MNIDPKDRGKFETNPINFGRQMNEGNSVSKLPIESECGVSYHDNCGTGLVDTIHL